MLLVDACIQAWERLDPHYNPEDGSELLVHCGRPYGITLESTVEEVSANADTYRAFLSQFLGVATDSPTLLNFQKTIEKLSGQSSPEPQTKKSAGEKWASPGRLVCSWPDLDLTARAVMFVMAAHGNDRGENIWISQSKIGDYIGRDRTTVWRAMQRLEKAGAVTRTAEPSQHKPTTYKLNRGVRVV